MLGIVGPLARLAQLAANARHEHRHHARKEDDKLQQHRQQVRDDGRDPPLVHRGAVRVVGGAAGETAEREELDVEVEEREARDGERRGVRPADAQEARDGHEAKEARHRVQLVGPVGAQQREIRDEHQHQEADGDLRAGRASVALDAQRDESMRRGTVARETQVAGVALIARAASETVRRVTGPRALAREARGAGAVVVGLARAVGLGLGAGLAVGRSLARTRDAAAREIGDVLVGAGRARDALLRLRVEIRALLALVEEVKRAIRDRLAVHENRH